MAKKINAAGRYAVLRPGDTLVVAYDYRIDDFEYTRLMEQWQPLSDQGFKILIADGVSSLAVLRPGKRD